MSTNNRLWSYLDGLIAYASSQRMQLIAGCVLLTLFHERLGIDDATMAEIRTALIAAVIGSSLRPPGQPNPPISVAPAQPAAPRDPYG